MIRTITFAALAAALLAAPAANAQTIRVQLKGKTPEQVQTELRAAAVAVCDEASADATLRIATFNACLRATMTKAKAQIAGTRYAMAEPEKIASR